MFLSIQNLTYQHPDREILFQDLSMAIEKGDKIALIGNNGSGKSTRSRIIAGELTPVTGEITTAANIY